MAAFRVEGQQVRKSSVFQSTYFARIPDVEKFSI